MASRTTPVDIATSSRATSPRNTQVSNLTSALQSTSGNEIRPTTAIDMNGTSSKGSGGPGGVISASQSSGAQPISMNASNRERPRRESLASSMVTGMSWGGASVGSWIRDDIIMQGTSPFPYQSPSFHSDSYLPKLEANFMKDFSCCGFILPTLHELLQHYEENHTDQARPSTPQQGQAGSNVRADPRAASAATAADAVRNQGRAQEEHHPQRRRQQEQPQPTEPAQRECLPSHPSSTPATPRQAQAPAQITRGFQPTQPRIEQDDAMADMEMEDVTPFPQWSSTQNQARITQRSQFGQPASRRIPNLDVNTMNMGNPLQQHQGLRNSQPATPVSGGRNGTMYYNNPTVSSVNTPTLTTYPSAHPLQQQFCSPESSTPGTPLDGDFLGNMGNMNVGNLQYMQSQNQDQTQGFGGIDFTNTDNSMGNFYIDEPAKNLISLNGAFNQPQQPAQPTSAIQLGDGQYSENSDLARTIREQQKLAGVPDPSADGGVPKPFHCPVIGCEKAYKNQNGLKYHKSHGHNTQTLKDNENGTFSIVDPETLNPYPGTMGMEKHKPYRCDTCGKRYKNLNGLKYHKNHSSACDSEIQTPFPHHHHHHQQHSHHRPSSSNGGQHDEIPDLSTNGMEM